MASARSLSLPNNKSLEALARETDKALRKILKQLGE